MDTESGSQYPFQSNLRQLREHIDLLRPENLGHSSNDHFVLILRIAGVDKMINSFNLEIGSQIIDQMADEIRRALRDKDLLLRISDRDFALILPAVLDRSLVQLAANKVLNRISSFCKRNLVGIYRGCIGATLYPMEGQDSHEVIRSAFMAMLMAEKSQAPFVEYSPACLEQISQTLLLEESLINCVANNELDLVYQPQQCLKTNRMIGAEVLLRWNRNPKLGSVSPMVFIPLAEQIGFVDELTNWVLDRSLNAFLPMQEKFKQFNLSINLSAVSLGRDDLVDHIANSIDLWRVPPQNLTLEITETAMLDTPDKTREILRQLKSLGIKISIDDFGTGYSSLAYLNNLPIDELKIDKCFTQKLATNENNQRIVKTILSLANNFGLEVVAEGIEDLETLELLQAYGCQRGQGYFIARPMEEEALLNFLRDSD